MADKTTCDDHNDNADLGYAAWHEWAERRGQTHEQTKCDECGMYRIWKPKKKAA